MKQTTKKAVVATIRYAGFEFPGLKLANGKYAITQCQASPDRDFSDCRDFPVRPLQ